MNLNKCCETGKSGVCLRNSYKLRMGVFWGCLVGEEDNEGPLESVHRKSVFQEANFY